MATSSASGLAHAYSSASASSIPVSTSRMIGIRSIRVSLAQRAAWRSREVAIVSYGSTSTYFPFSADIVAAPMPIPPGQVPWPRGTNWRPSFEGESASRGFGLGPQTAEPRG
jgi:hypothetical protein